VRARFLSLSLSLSLSLALSFSLSRSHAHTDLLEGLGEDLAGFFFSHTRTRTHTPTYIHTLSLPFSLALPLPLSQTLSKVSGSGTSGLSLPRTHIYTNPHFTCLFISLPFSHTLSFSLSLSYTHIDLAEGLGEDVAGLKKRVDGAKKKTEQKKSFGVFTAAGKKGGEDYFSGSD